MTQRFNKGIATDKLEFYYNMYDNRSYKGVSGTNIVDNDNLVTGWSTPYTQNLRYNDYPPPSFIDLEHTNVVSWEPNPSYNPSSYYYSYGNYAPQSSSTQYFISLWVRSIGQDFGVTAYTGNNSEVGRIWTVGQTVTANGEWQRLEWAPITTIASNDSDSLSFYFAYRDAGGNISSHLPQGQRVWLCAPAMRQASATYSYFPYFHDTPSSTLIDLTGNATIASYNPIHQTDGTFEFYRSYSQYIDINNFPDITFKNYTLEAWVYPSSYGGDAAGGIIGDQQFSWLRFSRSSVGTLIFVQKYYSDYPTNSTEASAMVASSVGALPVNTWKHVVATHSDVDGMKLYINGQLDGTGTTAAHKVPWNLGSSRGPRYVGIFNPSTFGSGSSEYWQGLIPIVRMYTKDLTAAEVLQNYNSEKARFGL